MKTKPNKTIIISTPTHTEDVFRYTTNWERGKFSDVYDGRPGLTPYGEQMRQDELAEQYAKENPED